MSEEKRKILDMLAAGKLSVDDAERLLNAVEASGGGEKKETPPADKAKPRYMIVHVDATKPDGNRSEKVRIRVPLQMLRAGVKLASIMPSAAKDKVHQALHEKGINFDLDNLKSDDIEDLIAAMGELTVDVDDAKDQVRIYCE